MRIGILGGSFDPPHFGHILVARQVKEFFNLDEIWLMPYFMHSWDFTISSVQDRLAMAKMIEEPGIIVSDEEIKYKRKSYTIETVRRLKKQHSHTFFWIVGGDTLDNFKRWKRYEDLIREIKFIVFPRNGYYLSSKLPKGFELISSPELVTTNISSSIIRQRIVKNLSVDGLISNSVLSYIRKHKLYK